MWDVTSCSLNKSRCHRFHQLSAAGVCVGAVWVMVALAVCRGPHTPFRRNRFTSKIPVAAWKIKGGAGTQVGKTLWPFKSGQCCVPRVFNGDGKGLRKTLLYMVFSIAACAIVLSLLPDRRLETERERGKEGGRGGWGSPRGSRTRKRGVIPQKTKFWAVEGVNV